MEIKEFYGQSLGIQPPWRVAEVSIVPETRAVEVRVECDPGTLWVDPETGGPATVHGWRDRRWRHLDTCDFETWVIAKAPWITLSSGSVINARVPWAEDYDRFTTATERRLILVLKLCPKTVEAVAMDMWPAFIAAVGEKLPDAAIVFDRFHVKTCLNQAVDRGPRPAPGEPPALGGWKHGLTPLIKAAETLSRHFAGLMNYITLPISNLQRLRRGNELHHPDAALCGQRPARPHQLPRPHPVSPGKTGHGSRMNKRTTHYAQASSEPSEHKLTFRGKPISCRDVENSTLGDGWRCKVLGCFYPYRLVEFRLGVEGNTRTHFGILG